MKNDIYVSVIIPVYNTEKYLRDCLNSVVNQTLREIEIICVDDGSTDNSPAILQKYAAEDSRITVLTKPHSGLSATRNLGLKNAAGKYFIILDSDDYFELDMLEDCYRALESEDADIVCFAANIHDMRDGSIRRYFGTLVEKNLPNKKTFAPAEIQHYLFNTFHNYTWNKMMRKSFIDQWRLEFQEIERSTDTYFVYLALVLAERITVINHAYVYYRIGTGTSLQDTKYETPLCFWDSYVETKRGLMQYGLYERYEQSFLNRLLLSVSAHFRDVTDPTASAAIFCCIKYRGETDFQFSEHDDSYYYNQNDWKEYKNILTEDIFSCKYTYNAIKEAVRESILNESKYYRIGRSVTWPPRKTKGFFQCIKDNGMKYTIRHLFEKIHHRLQTQGT